MNKRPLAAIINFCTNESRFLRACIEQTRLFAKQIIIPVCDHFFDGTCEDLEALDRIYRSFPDCTFVQYPFIPEKIPTRVFKSVSPAHFWHSLSRLIGVNYLDPSIETILFLDADEVPDGRKFSEWIENSDYQQHIVLKMANFWYFREPRFQAVHHEDSVVLAQRRALTAFLLLHERERDALYDLLPGPKRRGVTAPDGEPMFHHFSWVRTQEEMLKKVQAWGHKGDRNWVDQVNQEFLTPFQGIDFIHGYQYKTVSPPFDIRLEPASFNPALAQTTSLKRVSPGQVVKFIEFKKNAPWKWISQIFQADTENP